MQSCKIKVPSSCHPTHSSNSSTAPPSCVESSRGYWDIWGNYHTTVGGGQAGHPARDGRGRGFAADHWSGRSPRWRAREWERLLPPAVVVAERVAHRNCRCNVPAEVARASARTSRCAARTAKPREFELNLWELPQIGSHRNERPHVGAQAGARCRSTCRSGYHEITVQRGRGRAPARATS